VAIKGENFSTIKFETLDKSLYNNVGVSLGFSTQKGHVWPGRPPCSGADERGSGNTYNQGNMYVGEGT